MSVASCPPNLLATASYDGEIIVWNMVSGHDCCHLRSPVTPELDESPGGSKRGHQHVIQLVRFLQYFHMSWWKSRCVKTCFHVLVGCFKILDNITHNACFTETLVTKFKLNEKCAFIIHILVVPYYRSSEVLETACMKTAGRIKPVDSTLKTVVHAYIVSHKNGNTKLMWITSSNLNRFSKIFHWQILLLLLLLLVLQTFKSIFYRTTWVSRYQKGKTSLDLNEARDDDDAVASTGPYANNLHLAPDR